VLNHSSKYVGAIAGGAKLLEVRETVTIAGGKKSDDS
jgi:hypothetical protein